MSTLDKDSRSDEFEEETPNSNSPEIDSLPVVDSPTTNEETDHSTNTSHIESQSAPEVHVESAEAGAQAPVSSTGVPEISPVNSSGLESEEEAKPRKKRLTLQERLALAAKAKRKHKASIESTATSENTPEPENTPKTENATKSENLLATPDTASVTKESEVEVPRVEKSEKLDQEEKSLQAKDAASKLDHGTETPKLEEEVQSLKKLVASLTKENSILKQSQARTSQPMTDDWKRKLAEKDSTIQQLMEEGQALSKKELKLNERVKSLVQENTQLEASLKSYSAKNEAVLLKLGEIEDVMKVHKLKSVDQLLEHLEETKHKLIETQTRLEKEKSANWEAKYKESQRLYENELNEKKSVLKQLNESSIHLQMLENQSELALKSKDELITQLNQQIISIKDESSVEISRLESKIENLRSENEDFLKMSHDGKPSSSETDASSNKQIDYTEYAKLSASHRDLQAQYVSSQENWKIIESNLQGKISMLTSSLESLNKGKAKNTQEIRKLNNLLGDQSETIRDLESQIESLKSENTELNLQLQIKMGEFSELEDKLEELRNVFNSDRQNYDLKIQSLTETIQKYEGQTTPVFQSISSDNLTNIQSRRLRDSGLHINMMQGPIDRHPSYNSFSSMNTPSQPWNERGELSNSQDSRPIEANFSATSLTDVYNGFDDSEALAPEDGEHMKPETPSLPAFSSGANNIQLINKMSSTIRRLEIELMSIREENEALTKEKNEAQQEILGKYEVEARVQELESSMTKLSQELKQKSKKEETLLEVIGEKSERVAELQADVEDLKDLCRQQVQQMIDMAENKK
ncbi:hypothetical protein EJF18_60036 [Clavispora lusitaniae]|uniref:Uncharacterized protein n=1 Tax=Clavispora lusitaniae TaxID=36911 RepID=A0ACD0WQ99_CLALS|nr:hypothetical protein EJF14_60036 [Clavispora lusitaniae]QFZ35176.1 hypothetical protein EJF16_60036 [Clavispora lusitaniae]QFZ40870.1 hypothetical protein EJF15_60036 [Clavispora lusitaniae]QFZ46551.1 hypothetical protein EJF18_60036 [Clavispora lusitaniae]QFZ52216.1 hypothetical protein EJF17_60036 [Clavispora lusitaniae]